MAYDTKVKQSARNLRSRGRSIKEISEIVNVSVATVSVWVRNVELSELAKDRLKKRREYGNYLTSQRWISKRKEMENEANDSAIKILSKISNSKEILVVYAAILYWAEGNKTSNHVGFTNSDPDMVSVYLHCLRTGFNLDEAKFRALVHIHEYHDDMKTRKYWSNIASIPLSQFSKSYRKPNTGIRKKTGYKGSVRIRYYDSKIARQLKGIYNNLGKSIGA